MSISVSLRKTWWAGIAAAMIAGGFSLTAAAQGGSVIYSYERMAVAGGAENVLVPVADTDLRGEVSKDLLERAFERLRRAKRGTYGNSYAEVTGRGANLRVEVHIANDKRQFAPIIIAEAVYTLTEMGADRVYFPGHADGGLSRAEIPFSAFALTVPLWKVVPETAVTTAQVLMPDGELLPISEVKERWRSDRSAVTDAVYSYLGSEEDILVRSVVRILPDLGRLRLDAITPLLVHSSGPVRQEVLTILEGQEENEAVLAAMTAAMGEESNAALARSMAAFLGRSSNKNYSVQESFYLIANGEDQEAVEAARGLDQWSGDPRVVEVLSQSLRDERKDLAMAARAALGGLGSDQVRMAALDDESVAAEVRTGLAEDLASEGNGDEARLAGLSYLARERSEGHANQAISAMAGLSIEEARGKVESFLSDESRTKRGGAMNALIGRGDVASVGALLSAGDALAGADEAAEGDMMRAAAYDLMVSQPLATIIEQTSAGSPAVQEVAFQAVGERALRDGGNASAMSTVEAGTRHRSPAIRGAAARALGELGGERSVEILGGMLNDSSPVVRRAVAISLGKASSSAFGDELEAYLDDSDPGVVAAAIDAMDRRVDQRASERIREMISHADGRVRASAIRAVTTFIDRKDENTVRQHMAMLGGVINDEDYRVQLSALAQLGTFEDRLAVNQIAILVGHEDVVIRRAAVRALGETGHESAVRILESALGDRSPEVRRDAIDSLATLAGAGSRARLQQRAEQEEDPEVQDHLRRKLQEI